MPGHDAFIRAICEHPADDGPRLVFADWLDEQGDPRGEFIRLMCEQARMPEEDVAGRRRMRPRIDALAKEHGKKWRAELPRLARVVWGPFDRGLVGTVRVPSANVLLRNAAGIFSAAPITQVWFDRLDAAEARALAESPWLARIDTLKVHGCELGDDGVRALADSPHAAGLKRLLLTACGIGDDGARALARSRFLQNLRLLFLNANRIHDEGAIALAECQGLEGLEQIWLTGNAVGEAGRLALRRRWGGHASS